MGPSSVFKSLRIYGLAVLAALVIRLLYASIRWNRVGFDQLLNNGGEKRPLVFAFWHGRMLMACPTYTRFIAKPRKRVGHMLISKHGDGRIIAAAVRLLGVRSVAGSSSRGGMAAVRELVRTLHAGHDIGITPDGPRGPRYECKKGIVTLAQLSGAPIYPFAFATEKVWQLRSWDGMIIPRPFTRGVAILGAPIVVSMDEDADAARQRIQEVLHGLTTHADSYWTR
jgi:lysophospholipid acyltransferase (LPLAT)-like uncharacterized protein